LIEVLADTNALLWLMSASDKLSASARQHLDNALTAGIPIAVSVVTLVEMTYLIEKRRIEADAMERVKSFSSDPEAPLNIVPFEEATADLLATLPRGISPICPIG